MKNILIIEDDEKVSDVIKAYLQKDGYLGYCTTRGLQGIELFHKVDFKLVILDLMLPDIEGEEVCRMLRKISDVHIFILTAKAALNDKIKGLNIGADVYLTKPFSPRELSARVNALFRRLDANKNNEIISEDGQLSINPDKRLVKLREREITMSRNEFNILYTIARHSGNVLSREELIEQAIGIDFTGSDRAIDSYIKNIRKKIGEAGESRYILTVSKFGYKFGEIRMGEITPSK